MLNILWMILLIIILLIISFLLLGVKITLNYTKIGSDIKGCLKVLIFKKIKIYSINYPRESESDDESEKKDRDNKKISKLLKPCLKDLFEFLKTFLKSIKIIKIENHLIFGKESYADTGKYIGMIWGILSIINSLDEKIKITATPTFTGEVLDAKGINEFEIRLIKLIIPIIKLISKKDVRRLIKGVLDER